MSIEYYEKREKLIELKEKLLIAEEQRIKGEKTLSLEEVYSNLMEKINSIPQSYR